MTNQPTQTGIQTREMSPHHDSSNQIKELLIKILIQPDGYYHNIIRL